MEPTTPFQDPNPVSNPVRPFTPPLNNPPGGLSGLPGGTPKGEQFAPQTVLAPRHSKFLPILLIIILLILIGGGAFAYTVVFEAPRAALTKSFATIIGARTFHQETSIKANLESPVAITAEGSVAIDVERGATASAPNRSAIVINGKSGGFSVGAELRFIDDTLYGNIKEFPFL